MFLVGGDRVHVCCLYPQSPSGDGSYQYGRVQVCNLNLAV